VASRFVENAFRRITKKPILRVALPVTEFSDIGLTRSDFGLDDGRFIFLTTFDFHSSLHRKNPFAVIDAFRIAFPRGRKDVQLLIKSSNGRRYPDSLHQLLAAASVDDRIAVRDEVIGRAHVRALQRCADSYVSLHRAEGFGLGLAECMALGKPVIGTGWSGNIDFMTPDNSCLVDYSLVPVGKDEYPHLAGAKWAQANVNHAAAYMRRIVDDPEFAARISRQAHTDIKETLSPERAAARIIERLSEVIAQLPTGAASSV